MAVLQQAFRYNLHGAALLPATASSSDPRFLFTEADSILLQNLSTGNVDVVGTGYQQLGSIVADDSQQHAFVADMDSMNKRFTIYHVDLASADQANAKPVFKGTGQPMQMAIFKNTLFFVDRIAGELVEVNIKSKKSSVLQGGLAAPAGLLISPDGKRVYISESKAGRILSYSSGTMKTELKGLQSPVYLSWYDDKASAIVLTERGTTSAVKLWKPGSNKLRILVSPTDGNMPVGAWVSDKLMIVAELKQLLWYDLKAKPAMPVTLKINNDKPFIGSFERIQVDFGTSGLNMDSVIFNIPDGEAAGTISLSKDDLSLANEIMLLVGYRPGPCRIEVIDKITSSIVAVLNYEITDVWTDADKSPSHWAVGELSDFTTGYTWGGGPSTPQNVDVIPQSGTRNVCIVMVDTSTARYPTGTAFDTIRNEWQNGTTGTTADADGKVRSAKAYFEEVSHGTFTLALAGSQVLSVALSTSWTDNFSAMSSPFPSNSFKPTSSAAFAQACVSAAAALTDGNNNALVDFKQVQTLIMVIRSKGTASTDDFFWPQAWGGSFTIPGGSATMRVLGMPDDWSSVRDTRAIFETLSHEIGHNLGYPDLYTNANPLYSTSIIARDVQDFDLMSRDGELPHVSVGQKMETGWVRPEWVMPFDFSRSTIPLDTTVTLQASELGAPPAGQFSAAEIRLADGWNYYFEYRKTQSTQIGDQSLSSGGPDNTGDGVILGTDMITQSFTFPIARPQVIRLERDAENENSFFANGQDYKETDTSSMAVADFKMSVQSVNGNTAQIRIQYGTNGRPDLYIRPWPGGDNWQSPDIEVQNARSLADPGQWTNVPWLEHANTIIARYRNRGPVTARNVRVDFYIKDFTISNAPEIHLGSDTKDVPPESSSPFVEFTTSWIPANDGHKCIIVKTPLYIDASVNPNIVEITDSNNIAQSNYTRYIAAKSSPAKRGISEVAMHNPFSERAEVYVIPQIRGPFARFYRMYLECSALKLNAGETKKVQVLVESMFGDPAIDDIIRQYEKKFFTDTRMTLTGYGIPPEAPEHPVLLGGVQINVGSGRGTRFEMFAYVEGEDFIRGQVLTTDGAPVPGKVLLTFHANPMQIDNTITVKLDASGYFFLRGASRYANKFKAKKLTAHYPGAMGYAPCDANSEIQF